MMDRPWKPHIRSTVWAKGKKKDIPHSSDTEIMQKSSLEAVLGYSVTRGLKGSFPCITSKPLHPRRDDERINQPVSIRQLRRTCRGGGVSGYPNTNTNTDTDTDTVYTVGTDNERIMR
ncbi:hypothetical protein ACMFMF_003009 [Clarireedia jacksonii]